YYRRGDIDKAIEYRHKLLTWPGRNINDWEATEKLAWPIDQYVEREMMGRYTSPPVYVNQISAALVGAFTSALLAGDQDLFQSQYNWARQFHAYFIREQNKTPMLASPETGRMENLPKDFRVLAGGVFTNLIASLSEDERETMYLAAPN